METNEINDENDDAVVVLGNETPDLQQEELKQEEQKQEEDVPQSFVMNVLDTLGLVNDFPEVFKFDKDFDVDSDEGITQVIQKTFELGENAVLNNIKSNPELYSLFLHFQDGGNLDSFKNDNISTYSDEQLKENINLQTEILKNNLRSKDIQEDIIDAIVSKIIEKEELEAKALQINNDNKKNNDIEISKKEGEINAIKLVNQELGETLSSIVSDSISSNKFSSLKLNHSEKEKLYNDLSNNIDIVNGEAYYKVKIKDENINALIENHLLLINPSLKSKLVSDNKNIEKVSSLRDKRNVKKEKVEVDTSKTESGNLLYNMS